MAEFLDQVDQNRANARKKPSKVKPNPLSDFFKPNLSRSQEEGQKKEKSRSDYNNEEIPFLSLENMLADMALDEPSLDQSASESNPIKKAPA